MSAIVAWSLRFRRLLVAAAAAVIVFGVAVLPGAPVDALPEISPPYVEVQTEALGLSAEEVEQLITVPLEADLLNGVAWLDRIESESVQSLSSIVMTFEPGTDPIRARQMVAERLTQAHALPNVSKAPVMLQPLSSSNRLLMMSLSSDDLSLIDMSVLARWTIKPRLLGVSGVANVSIWGQRERQLQVLVDPQRLQAADVTLEEVIETAGNALWVSPLTFLEASTPGTGGFIDTPNQRLGIHHVLPIDGADDLANVTVATDSGRYRLSDVASVVEDHQPLIGDAIVNDGDGLILVVEKFPGANTLEVTRAVEEAMAALGPAIAGITVDTTLFRPATFLERAVDNITLAVIIGLVLAIAVIAGLLYDWRAALVSLVTIPVSLVAAGLALYAMGATFNAIVVAGFVVAIGIVVDDAVITATSVRARLATTAEEEAPRAARVMAGAVAVRGSTVYASLVLLLTLIPLYLVGEATGAMLAALASAYVIALLASMLVSLTIAPALTFMLLRAGPLERGDPHPLAWLHAAYGALLLRFLNRTRPAFMVAGAAAVAAVVLFAVSMAPSIGQAAEPRFQDRDLLIHWDGAPSTSHTEMRRIVAQASGELRELSGVRSVGAHVGRAIFSDQVVGINSSVIWLSIATEADYEATLAAVQDVVGGYPGLRRQLLTYGAERVSEIVERDSNDIVVRVYGNDQTSVLEQANELQGRIAGIPGISAPIVDAPVMEPTVQISVDLPAAERHGLKPGDIRRTSATLLSGIEVGSLFEGQKVFEVVVWGVPELRQNLSTIRDLPIETASGDLIPLADVASIEIVPGPVSIRREGSQRIVDIGATVSGRDVGAVLADVQQLLATTSFPLETHAEVLPFTAERQAAEGALLAAGAAVLIGTFLLLQAAFVSWRLAAFVLLSLPAALSGGVLVALVLGDSGRFGAVLGLLAVLGIAVRNGILLVERYRQLEREGAPRDQWLAVRGAREQLVPMLTTALAMGGLLLPFAVLGARAGVEIIHPMSLVILGGLVSSILVNLFIVPSLFVHTGPTPEAEIVTESVEQATEPQVIGAG